MPIVSVDLGDLGVADGSPSVPLYFHAPWYDDLKACQACPIRGEARQVVPGAGPADAEILLLGQNPGQEEDEDGRGFIGRAGKELDRWLEILGLDRGRLVVSNVVKCHTKDNRTPKPKEATFCGDRWVPQELAYLSKVSVILTLGDVATRACIGKPPNTVGLASLVVYWVTTQLDARIYTIYPFVHPAYVGRVASARERIYQHTLPELKAALQRNHPEAYGRSSV